MAAASPVSTLSADRTANARDWKRHKREHCFTLVVATKEQPPVAPAAESTESRGYERMGDDQVAGFFNGSRDDERQAGLPEIHGPWLFALDRERVGPDCLPVHVCGGRRTLSISESRKPSTLQMARRSRCDSLRKPSRKPKRTTRTPVTATLEGFLRHKNPHTFLALFGS